MTPSISNQKFCFTFALLCILLFIVYANSFKTSWHLDDYANITQNITLRLKNLMPETLKEAFFAHPTTKGKLYRPLPMLSFALNWYWGQDHVFGYHLVNLSIHILTTWILFLVIFNLHLTPALKYYKKDALFISLMATVLWALNPIQTQAVTYIVQRMASMAAMFYILSMFCYLKARLCNEQAKQILYFSGSLICFLAALGSKENTITLPLTLIMLEFIFFQNKISTADLKKFILIALLVVCIIFAFGVIFFLKGDLFGFMHLYNDRPFSLSERLMTESRIVLFYLSQIIYPIPGRLSISHDFLISTSLLKPWTTLPAILLVFSLIGLGLSLRKKYTFIAFPILFYFLCHSIESTIFGLELFFEHRNYLPSLFLFWPVAYGVHKILLFYKESNPFMFRFIVTAIILLMIGFGIGTHLRNMAWASEKSLWEDAITKAPTANRPLHNLAYYHYEPSGDYITAMALLKKSLALKVHSIKRHSATYNNIASIYYYDLNENNKAAYYWDKALELYPANPVPYVGKSIMYFNAGRWKKALKILEKAKTNKAYGFDGTKLNGFILLENNRPDLALPFYQKIIHKKMGTSKTIGYLGLTLTRLGHLKQGYWFLKQADTLKPGDNHNRLYLAENRSLAGEKRETERLIDLIIDNVGPDHIEAFLIEHTKTKMRIAAKIELFMDLLTVKLEQKIIEMEKSVKQIHRINMNFK